MDAAVAGGGIVAGPGEENQQCTDNRCQQVHVMRKRTDAQQVRGIAKALLCPLVGHDVTEFVDADAHEAKQGDDGGELAGAAARGDAQ